MTDQSNEPHDFPLILVQDFVRGEDRIARADGSHFACPGGTVLPWLKQQGIRLKKLEEEHERFREFEFTVRVDEDNGLTDASGFVGWPLLMHTMRSELAATAAA